MTDSRARYSEFVLYGVIGIFLTLRFTGQFFPENWSFVHWQSLPGWYGPVWIAILALFVGLFLWHKFLSAIVANPKVLAVFALALALILWLFRFDSFLYGGGNLRVAQLSQADIIVVRWFEWGSVLLAKLFYSLFQAIGFEPNSAGEASWRTFSFACTAVSAIACRSISLRLAAENRDHLLLFLILFFGPQAVLLFGFVGLEPVVVAVTQCFLLACLKLVDSWSSRNLLWVWCVAAIGIILHVSLVYLLPAAIFMSLAGSQRGVARKWAGLAGAILVLGGLLVALYVAACSFLEFSTRILFIAGKLPHSLYSLFSPDHVSDIGQIILLAAPLAILVLFLRVTVEFDQKGKLLVYTSGLVAACGFIALLVQDPQNSMPLEYPRLTAYLTGFAFCLAILLSRSRSSKLLAARCLPMAAAFAFLLPFAILPIYVRIYQSEPYMSGYIDSHEDWCRLACYNYRDAFFGRKDLGKSEIERANAWEAMLPSRSTDYLTYRGSLYLIAKHEQISEAQRQLNNLVARNPYWTEPRTALVSALMTLRQFDRAKAQIDTCLMLEPYNPLHFMTLYGYYRDAGNLPAALAEVQKARAIFPHNEEISVDEMIINYRAGNTSAALAQAGKILSRDPSMAFPYLIRAFDEDHLGKQAEALRDYQMFMNKQKDQPETLQVKQRIAELSGSRVK